MDEHAALAEIDYIKELMGRTHRRIDTHSFHSVHWGVIVLVWYPLINYFAQRGWLWAYALFSVACFALGAFLSGYREYRLAKRPRLEAGDTSISDQVAKITAFTMGVAGLLSGLGPALGFIPGPQVPVIWGVAYAVMAYMIGVVYTREYRMAGLVIMVGAILAMVFPDQSGYILGPFMGIGMIVPGVMGERRVARIVAEDAGQDV